MSESLQTALGWAVLHFLWQGAILGLLAGATLAVLRKDDNRARYAVACSALGVALVTFASTFVLSIPEEALPALTLPPTVDVAAPELAEVSAILAGLTATPAPRAEIPAAALAWFWALGALAMALRLSRGGLWARRLRRSGEAPDDPRWQRLVDALRTDLGISRAVRILRSELVDGPAVVGWLTPVILVPATTLTALTPDQVRAVLAHELAHVRRHDHLVNALQALVEVLLFFHPVVWWLSHVVREEREHCCDVAAVRATGSELLLAQALTRLESLRLDHPSVALAAKTSRGPLMNRITRILRSNGGAPQRHLGWRALSVLGAGALALGLGVAQAAAAPVSEASSAARISLEGRDVEADYAVVEARILQAVEAGNLSAEAAKRTLAALRKTMFSNERRVTDRRPTGFGDVQRRRLDELRERERREVERTDMARQRQVEVEKRRLDEMRERQNAGNARGQQRRTDRATLDDVRKRVELGIKSGDITPEQGRERIDEFRQRREVEMREVERREAVRRDVERQQLENARRRYSEAEREVKAALEGGKISYEDAEKRMIKLRRELFGDDGARATDRRRPGEARRRETDRRPDADRWRDTDRRPDADGWRETDRRPDTDRRRETDRRPDTDRRRDSDRVDPRRAAELADRKAEYDAYLQRVEAAVASGRISKADAEKRVKGARKELFGDVERDRPRMTDAGPMNKKSVEAAYSDFARRVEAAVKRGDLSSSDGKKKISAYKKELRAKMADEKKKASQKKKDAEKKAKQDKAAQKKKDSKKKDAKKKDAKDKDSKAKEIYDFRLSVR